MSSFFRSTLLSAIILLFCTSTSAITIYSLHTMECERDLGLILEVRPFEVVMLNLTGEVKTVRNYEIIYMSSYSVNQIPLRGNITLKDVNGYEVYTRVDNTPLPLVKGFPVDFTQEKISIINFDGGETVIEKNKIWSIQKFSEFTLNFNYSSSVGINFDMPQIFRDCQKSDIFPKDLKKSVSLYPLQTLNDPLAIKRELDRLRTGYDQIQEMNQEQQFYGEPQYFKNAAILGTWANMQSRYGSSTYRTNQFLPTLLNTISDGPFDYQQRTITGVAPIPRGSHDESQAQLSYELKFSYFHLYLMFDPNLMLVGQNYDWTKTDFNSADVRVVDKTLFEFGFDYSAFSLQFYLNHNIHAGFYDGANFASQDFAVPRFGISYRGLLYNLFLSSGYTELNEKGNRFSIGLTRIQAELTAFKNFTAKVGYLSRITEVSELVNIKQEANSLYLEGNQYWNRRYFLGALISNESIKNRTLNQDTQSTFFKTALFVGFIF